MRGKRHLSHAQRAELEAERDRKRNECGDWPADMPPMPVPATESRPLPRTTTQAVERLRAVAARKQATAPIKAQSMRDVPAPAYVAPYTLYSASDTGAGPAGFPFSLFWPAGE